jgi:hypothetical protein
LSIEERIERLEKRVQKLEDSLVARNTTANTKPDSIESLIIANVRKIETQDLVVLALKLRPKQTKAQVKTIIEEWGARVGNWFQGGNLNTRMVKKHIVSKDETRDGVMFSLTKKGEFRADKLINEIEQFT